MLAFNNWTNVVCLVSINPTYVGHCRLLWMYKPEQLQLLLLTLTKKRKCQPFFFLLFLLWNDWTQTIEEWVIMKRKKNNRMSFDLPLSSSSSSSSSIFPYFFSSISTVLDANIWMNTKENELFFSFRSNPIVIDCVNKNASSVSISLFGMKKRWPKKKNS